MQHLVTAHILLQNCGFDFVNASRWLMGESIVLCCIIFFFLYYWKCLDVTGTNCKLYQPTADPIVLNCNLQSHSRSLLLVSMETT